MTDTELGKLVSAAFDDVRFAETIQGRLWNAVAAVFGHGTAAANVRAGRMAADELATLLVAHQREAGRERAGTRAIGRRSTAVVDVEQRAEAFRAMAGVGI